MASSILCKQNRWGAAHFLTLYVVLHPFIDMLTYFGVQAQMLFTAGNILRTLFLAGACLYILFCGPFPRRRPLLLWLGVLTLYLIAFSALNFSEGGLPVLVRNGLESVKTFYFPYMAAFLYALYQKERFVLPDWALAVAGAGYCVVVLLAFLTNTSYISYNAGYGYCGWFFSANDVSAMILLTAPLLVYLCLAHVAMKSRPWVLAGAALALLSLVFSAAFIGTKLLYLGVFLYILLALAWMVVRYLRHREKPVLRCVAVLLVCCAGLVAIYPVSPLNHYITDIYTPMSGDDPDALRASLEIPGVVEKDRAKAYAEYEMAAEGTWLRQQMDTHRLLKRADWLLSKRLTMLAPILQEYMGAHTGRRLLGLGYVNLDAYEKDIEHMIEMEGPALWLRHGVIGFALYYIPFLGASVYLIVRFFRRFRHNIQDLRTCSLLYAVCVLFAASMLIGHILVPPCTGLVAALLYEKLLVPQPPACKWLCPADSKGQGGAPAL